MPPAPARLPRRAEGEAPLPRLYRPEEIAETLGCSAWWVKDRARRRLIPHMRVGRSYRFTADHLAEIIRIHEETPTQAAPRSPSQMPQAERTTAPQRAVRQSSASPRLRARPPRRSQYGTAA
ncbi:helix-turn-helix domain-containing protein [Streptomyces sp. P17]|uniref:helix-turn-helix domain-containing protein n=1 Tax=Streptomyces sp. P17 TaxID=3074716 RepID=UPI0028F420E3|nr:helix-turn-helix domain-containing protein [Streptomyces sp. P17]MDT9699534.1 helix-turn-helix domain-containing protein [Streptomyces sp. P17]